MNRYVFYGLITVIALVILMGGVLSPSIISRSSLNFDGVGNEGELGEGRLGQKLAPSKSPFIGETFKTSPLLGLSFEPDEKGTEGKLSPNDILNLDLGRATPLSFDAHTSNFVASIGGTTHSIFARGDYVYVGQGIKLLIFNIADPTTPYLIGFLQFEDFVRDIYVDGTYAYLANGNLGLNVVNISQPSNPIKVGQYSFSGYAIGIGVSNGYVYLADGPNGLRIIDASQPTNPIEVGFYDITGDAQAYIRDVTVRNNYAYLATGNSGLKIVDISQPSQPVIVGTYNTPNHTNKVIVKGNYVYLADYNDLIIVDITQLDNPIKVGVYDLCSAIDVKVVGDYAYVADQACGFKVLNIANPALPILVDELSYPSFIRGVMRLGDYAFLIGFLGGLRVVDISDPNNVSEVGGYDSTKYARGVTEVNNYVYLSAGEQGLKIIDISNPNSLIELGMYNSPGYVRSTAVVGNYAYIADEDEGLRIVDVSQPNNIISVGNYKPLGQVRDVQVVEQYAYVANGEYGLRIVDISQPQNPVELGNYDSPGYAQSVNVKGNYVYLADGSAGLRIIDVSNPANPIEVGFYDSSGEAWYVSIVNNYAYLADGEYGLRVLDVSQVNNPIEIGAYDSPGYANNLTIKGNYVYLADRDGGLRVIDISSPENPVEIDNYETQSFVLGVSVIGDYIYLASTESGLIALDYTYSSLSISKQGANHILSLTPITYTLTITNTGTMASTNLLITDTLPSNTTYITGGVLVGNQVQWRVQNLPPNSSTTVQFSVSVTTMTNITQTITNNQYRVSSDEGANEIGQIAVTTLVTRADPNLVIYKSGSAQTITNIPITYTLTVTNIGYTPAINLIVTDTVPNGSDYLSGGILTGNQVHWLASSLFPNENFSFQFAVTPTTNLSCTLINYSYGAVADDDIVATGQNPVITALSDGQAGQVYVFNQNAQPLTNTLLYYNGTLAKNEAGDIATPNPQGLFTTTPLYCTDQLVALQPVYEQPTLRQAHTLDGSNNFAYRVYLSSMAVDNEGNVQGYTVSSSTHQTHTLTINPQNTLILFNIVASLEWDATAEELAAMQQAFRLASDYLYDVTDGQMAFGWVNIYDNAEHWNDADFQFSVKNTVRPYAYVGAIVNEEDTSRAIRIGRFWDGRTGNTGAWTEPNGYRTLIHEFGHYALHLYDEYFLRDVDQFGNIINESVAACTSQLIRHNETDETNGSMMYYQYNASELIDTTRWTEDCQNTEQHRHHNEADWQTVLRYYSPPQGIATPWILQTPDSRGGVVAGPIALPTELLPFPTTTLSNTGMISGSSRSLTVLLPTGEPAPYVLVSLYSQANGPQVVIDQGITDMNGQITVYGASAGDRVRVATFDSAYAGSQLIDQNTSYTLHLQGTRKNTAGAVVETPYLLMAPSSDGKELYLTVDGLADTGDVLSALVQPNKESPVTLQADLAYDTVRGVYNGTVSLSGVGLGSGRVKIVSSLLNSDIRTDYRLQQTIPTTETILYAEDGNFQLHLPPNSTGDGIAHYTTIAPTGYVPGSIPESWTVLGAAYNVNISGGFVTLPTTATLKMHIPAESTYGITNTAIYRWSDENGVLGWHKVGGTPAPDIENALVVPINKGGIYALINGIPMAVYLPLIIK